MPKPRNPAYGGRKTFRPDCGNVTVYDYAHADGVLKDTDRQRKSLSNLHSIVYQELPGATGKALDDLDWDERSLDSFEVEIDSLVKQKNQVQKITNGGLITRNGLNTQSKWTNCPLDIWFLISRYVRPEDVGRFALICQATHYVTHTAHFWMQLYNRIHSRYPCELPMDLKSLALERIHGLRSRVIRSLHFAYPPYYLIQSNFIKFSENLNKLEGTECISSWHFKKTRALWRLFFKFKRPHTKCHLSQCVDEKTSYGGYHLLKGFSDLHHNPEKGCYLLVVTAGAYSSSIADAMGLNLLSIGVSVSRCMRQHRLKLVLDSRPYMKKQQPESKVICIDPTLNARFYAWWQPEYYSQVASNIYNKDF